MSNFEHDLEGNVKSLKTEEIVLLFGDQDKQVETKSTSNVLFNDARNEYKNLTFIPTQKLPNRFHKSRIVHFRAAQNRF